MDVYDRNLTSAIRGTIDYIRGLRIIGIRTRERILPVGEKVTAIGEASFVPLPWSFLAFILVKPK